MSDVFNDYEQQYCTLWDDLSRKFSAFILNGERKSVKLSEITSDLESAEKLIRKMDLVVSSLPANIKSILLVRLREYNSKLKSLKRKIKNITSENVDASTQNDLHEAAIMMEDSADQRSRLMNLTEDLSRTTGRINDSRRKMQEVEESGVKILQGLRSQRQSLQCTQETLHGIDDNVIESESTLASMIRKNKEYLTIVGAIVIVILFKLVSS